MLVRAGRVKDLPGVKYKVRGRAASFAGPRVCPLSLEPLRSLPLHRAGDSRALRLRRRQGPADVEVQVRGEEAQGRGGGRRESVRDGVAFLDSSACQGLHQSH